jgi:hypothetical protein
LDSAGTRTKKRQRPNKKTCSGLKLVCCKRFTREAYLVILCFLYGHTVERKLRDKERLNLVFFYSFIPFFIYLYDDRLGAWRWRTRLFGQGHAQAADRRRGCQCLLVTSDHPNIYFVTLSLDHLNIA